MTGKKGNILLIASVLQTMVVIECCITLWTNAGVSEQTFTGNATKRPQVNVKREAPPSTLPESLLARTWAAILSLPYTRWRQLVSSSGTPKAVKGEEDKGWDLYSNS